MSSRCIGTTALERIPIGTDGPWKARLNENDIQLAHGQFSPPTLTSKDTHQISKVTLLQICSRSRCLFHPTPLKRKNQQVRLLRESITGRGHDSLTQSVFSRAQGTVRGERIICQLNPKLAELVTVSVPGGKKESPDVAAFVARPLEAPPRKLPVVIMIHEFYGLTKDIVGKAQALAEQLGALVIAPDTYRGDWTSFIPKAIFLALSTSQDRVNEDLESIVSWAAQQPDADVTRLAVMGFCYGGGKAIRYSTFHQNVAATVVFYGSPVTDVKALSRLKGPVLLVYGDRDGQFPPAKVYAFRDALLEAGVKVQLSMYPGQGHAFFRNMAQVEEGLEPQRQAWGELVAFLKGALF